MYAQKPYLWSKLIHNSDMYLKKQFIISERRWRTTHNSNTIFKKQFIISERRWRTSNPRWAGDGPIWRDVPCSWTSQRRNIFPETEQHVLLPFQSPDQERNVCWGKKPSMRLFSLVKADAEIFHLYFLLWKF